MKRKRRKVTLEFMDEKLAPIIQNIVDLCISRKADPHTTLWHFSVSEPIQCVDVRNQSIDVRVI